MSSRRQGLLRHVEMPAGVLRRGMNLWPPFLGAGVRVTRVADDYCEVEFTVAIVDRAGDTVAEVDKTLSMRRTQARAAAPASDGAKRRPRAKA